MITVTTAVHDIISSDEIALEALRANILNFSAYAQSILPEVERRAFKSVKLNTIVVALHRLSKTIDFTTPLKPDVRIQDLSIKFPLCELSFDKTAATIEKVSRLPQEWYSEEFFTITQGLREISIICSSQMKERVEEYFSIAPKGSYANLVAVTLRFNESDYIEQPNMIFTLVSALAGKRINLIEVVSTFTEISFIVRKNEMDETVGVLQQFFHSST